MNLPFPTGLHDMKKLDSLATELGPVLLAMSERFLQTKPQLCQTFLPTKTVQYHVIFPIVKSVAGSSIVPNP